MAEFLGLGMTHYPPLAGTDENMAGILSWTLTDPDIPSAEKDVSSWPELMRREWADDRGAAAAAGHRKQLLEGMRACRTALDEFAPDIVLVWGDDQYENFKEEAVPPFCVLAYENTDVEPFVWLNSMGLPNVWGVPPEHTFEMRTDKAAARRLTDDLLRADFDVAYSYRQLSGAKFPHAIGNTQLFLDYDNAGQGFPYPILPITVNCYGQHVIARRGGLARFADINNEDLDPVGPSPARCFALGAAVARALSSSDKRIALVASSSWSHAFLHDKGWHLRPDTPADQRLYDAFVRRDWDVWTATTADEVVAAGQHEMLNWFCLAGAMHELNIPLRWSEFVATDAFNSNKCFAIFDGKDTS
ncbi:MAG TPA: extradiol ring-cleavage dioxygenase [Pseudonocardia sp.]|jgi:hypothetical protein|nr:extradiol ring-cleavage dioxygenase [Pseudonocardia sp.]